MRVAEVIRVLACQLQALIRTIAGGQNLSPTQAQVIFSVPADGLSMSALARRLGLDASTMSRIIGKMAEHGWVRQKRDLSDRRVTVVRLTDSGRSLYVLLQDDLETRLESLVADLDTAGQEELLEPLESLAWRMVKARA